MSHSDPMRAILDQFRPLFTTSSKGAFSIDQSQLAKTSFPIPTQKNNHDIDWFSDQHKQKADPGRCVGGRFFT